MTAARFRTASLSSPGGRARNEDACGFRLGVAGAVWVVADGLGGHVGGERAAQLAVATLLERLGDTPARAPADLALAIDATQQTLLAARTAGGPAGAAGNTTVVVLSSDGERALWANVGDSRLYHFRGGLLLTQTRDHSVPQALAGAGEIPAGAIRGHEDRNRLLRCLGGEGTARPSVTEEPIALEAGDVFLLCSDGFWEPVTEEDMTATLTTASSPEVWLAEMELGLIERVAPGHDNYSALAIFVGPP
jgi:PPM family protein phosphatase